MTFTWSLSVLTLTAFSASAQPVLWDPAASGNGHFYEAVAVPGGMTWSNANIAAKAKGGHLATITSAAENDFVFSLVADDPQFWRTGIVGDVVGPWLGGFQPPGSPEPDGNWRWVTGEAFIFTSWDVGEPNNAWATGEDRLHFKSITGVPQAKWNDLYNFDDETPPLGYIVEYPLEVQIRVSEVEIAWQSHSNWNYQVEYRSSLSTNQWLTLPGSCVQGDGTIKRICDKVALGEPHKFYRVVVTNCVPGLRLTPPL